ncbi:hypothetical protein [Nostoc sp. 106C]|uniref:hypothetical protein n=1 Tax=Nostoc sp. 106C TaxID=1932667 RepID=UPI000A38261A|nr:hypothetical protein [Nostoc sp. 106C]OUL20894.1 hypothetical protein BV378_28535 [Nostoc sp. RF31YmG]OUL22520.1 hypothetical protein BV375_26725 [Nostoc sp. 106C]
MHISQAPYRELFDSILSYQGTDLYSEILHPWCANAMAIKAWLSDFATRSGSPIPEASIEDLWQLYALSRINDLLIWHLRDEDTEIGSGAEITSGNYLEFMRSLGFEVVTSRQFSPFYHEIVQVIQDEHRYPEITVISIFWDSLMLGDMIFSRAGACVAGGIANINKSIAEKSTLYWTYRRKTRKCQDLSYGWGSNSQWRTSFRRDYKINNFVYYNIDGKNDLNLGQCENAESDDLELQERIELVKHRCFITVNKPDDDLFPYDDCYCEALQ